MSNRSFPGDFTRPLREVPVATDADVQAMLARLRRRCAQISLQPSAGPSLQPAAPSVVSGGAESTATAGGGPHEAEHTASPPFQPTRPAPSLVWERISPTAMRTACGTWTCCRFTIGGYARYELWKRIAGLERPVCVKRGMTAFLEAQDIAQAEMDADNG